MKTIIISSVLILIFVGINVWMLSFKSPQLSNEDYKNFMESFSSANETVKKIEKFLLELPKMKNRDDIDNYIFKENPQKDSLVRIVGLDGKDVIYYENLRIVIKEDGTVDSVKLFDLNSDDYSKIILPKMSNFEPEENSFNYLNPLHILWKFFIAIFILMIIISSVYYKIKKKKIIQNSLITILLSILLLNFLHLGFYQKYEFYNSAKDIMSFGLMENFKIMSPLKCFNIMAYHTQIFATVFDVSFISIIFLSVVLIIKLKTKRSITNKSPKESKDNLTAEGKPAQQDGR